MTIDKNAGAEVVRGQGLEAAHKTRAAKRPAASREEIENAAFLRAENEDDDGYDPYSDRRPVSEPLFERDPWS